MTRFARLAVFAAVLLASAPLAQATIISYTADLSGLAESPPTASPATGSVSIDYDDVLHTLTIDASWSGLLGPSTVAHIHCCTAAPGAGNVGVAVSPGTLPGFPTVTAGTYMAVLDLALSTTYASGFLNGFGGGTAAGAETALIAGFDSGSAYFNIHTANFPGGEIRGFLAAVPGPATLGLLAAALFAMGRRRRATA